MFATCPVEWRDNPKAVKALVDCVKIEGHSSLSLPDVQFVSAVLLNHNELYFSYRRKFLACDDKGKFE
jgi:hypothetical protein